MKVMSSQPPTLDEGEDAKRFSKPLRAMVKRCLAKDPGDRATAVQLLKVSSSMDKKFEHYSSRFKQKEKKNRIHFSKR